MFKFSMDIATALKEQRGETTTDLEVHGVQPEFCLLARSAREKLCNRDDERRVSVMFHGINMKTRPKGNSRCP